MDNFIAVRGAVTVKQNSAEDITAASVALLNEILSKNCIEKNDIISVLFTLTEDLNKASPAAAVRHAGLVPEFAALFCMCEAHTENALPMCLRAMVNAKSSVLQRFTQHIYLGEARSLRPDLYKRKYQIAIDGPSGAGKTTIARIVSERMNINYLDTGALYRTVALAAKNSGVSVTDWEDVEAMLPFADIKIVFERKKQIMLLEGEDVSAKIREHSISREASDISKIPAVRAYVTSMCQSYAEAESIVMEGRDICGYVLPDADTKIYLDAAVETRAQRRFEQLAKNGELKEYSEILRDIIARDKNDMSRVYAPLKITEDALYIDGTELSVEEIFEKIIEAVGD